jgi:hypothetical protein
MLIIVYTAGGLLVSMVVLYLIRKYRGFRKIYKDDFQGWI